jgi:hypothetical protein
MDKNFLFRAGGLMEQSHIFYRLPAISFFAIPSYNLSLNHMQNIKAISVANLFSLKGEYQIFYLHIITYPTYFPREVVDKN